MNLSTLIKTSRPNFLLLPPVCVLLGVAAVYHHTQSIAFLPTFLVFIGALAAHISVNMLNEYHDAQSGLDALTEKTAFSGGSGALIADPKSSKATLVFGCLFALIAFLIGVYFVYTSTPWIIPVGLLGLFIVFAYTPWLNQNPLLCLVAPGLGFGTLMVLGTELALSGGISRLGLLLSLLPFFLVNNLLLVNQYPDVDADKQVGRNHALIAWGPSVCNLVYLFFSLMAFELVAVLTLTSGIPMLSLLAFLGLMLTLYTFYGLTRHNLAIGNYPHYMAANVVATLLTPLIVAVAVIAG